MPVLPANLSTLPPSRQAIVALAWQRFTESASTELIAAALERPELVKVWQASEYVSSWCIRQQHAFCSLLQSGDLDCHVDPQWYAQTVHTCLTDSDTEQQLEQILRQNRQRQMVRLAWRDLAGLSTLEETMEGVSELACASIEEALAWHYEALCQRYGRPRDDSGNEVRLIVLGLGKLGGGELNYSSDIDLMLVYDGAGQTDGEKSVDNQEFFIRLGRKIVNALDRLDANGFVFRTDMRLRPNGDSGPLVLSAAAMEYYYQIHGRNWERYALIKARVVAGDRPAGAALLNMLRPFVYRKYLDFSVFDSIRDMKVQIEQQLKAKGTVNDVKLGRGGIREIEFLVQNHQLIRGGQDIRLQTPSLYSAMAIMLDLGILKQKDHDTLIDAYRFLRNVEHRLQMVADRQTQLLPEDGEARLQLALAMNFPDWLSFEEALDGHRNAVHALFGELLASPDTDDSDAGDRTLAALWQGNLEQEQTASLLQAIGYKATDVVYALLVQFRDGSLYRRFSSIERDRLDRLMPLVIQAAANHTNARVALSAFIGVVEAIGKRSVYLSLLIENPLALKQLLHLCATSPWISRHIGSHPVVLDELLQFIDPRQVLDREIMQVSLEERLSMTGLQDEEARMNALREYHHAQVLRIASADIRQQLSAAEVQQGLSTLAEVLLVEVLDDAARTVASKQGPAPGEVAVIAYGKFASKELGYHSDLDIVVCFAADNKTPATGAEYYFSKMGQRFIHLLTTRTHAGILFKLDMRLRPSGRSGMLVSSFKAFEDYQMDSAWTWEHQALVRARIVTGSPFMTGIFEGIRQRVLRQQRQATRIATEISEMRERMVKANCQSDEHRYDLKLDYGGMVDIEFLLQYLVLVNAHSYPAITEPRTTAALIEGLLNAGLIDQDQAATLQSVYADYLQCSLQCKLMDKPVLIGQKEMLSQRHQIRQLWRKHIGIQLVDKVPPVH